MDAPPRTQRSRGARTPRDAGHARPLCLGRAAVKTRPHRFLCEARGVFGRTFEFLEGAMVVRGEPPKKQTGRPPLGLSLPRGGSHESDDESPADPTCVVLPAHA